MGTLLLPSQHSGGFLRISTIARQEALAFMGNFQKQQMESPATVDRVADFGCNIHQAPASEQTLGPDFQVLEDFDVMAIESDRGFDCDEIEYQSNLEALATSSFPGVRGQRALFIENMGFRQGSSRVSLILGTLVAFSERRYTREFWDVEISDQVQDSLSLERPEQTISDNGVYIGDAASAGEEATANPLQAVIVAQIANDLRKLGKGNLLTVPKDPVLLDFASRLDEVVAALGGVPQPEPVKGIVPPLDVDKVIEQGRVVLKDAMAAADTGVRKARTWLADRLNDIEKRR